MSPADSAALVAAYEHCRQVAKREAKNFYYAFRVLPEHKSDAMCAVYAFMRKADDLADDESMSLEQRRKMMAAWTTEWRESRHTASTDQVFIALKDTQERFGISSELLEQLIAGTTLDLYGTQEGVEQVQLSVSGAKGPSAVFDVYRSFNDLYRYCYLVASVVGLVCIRIFGYTDPRAEEYAERVGIAFQLTNILRDVVEDAERRRIYLPLDDLAEAGLGPESIVAATTTASATPGLISLLAKEISRAEDYYASVAQLVPLLDADSRVAMEVLATIYHRLLGKIASDPAAVLQGRVSVSTTRKVSILVRGLLRAKLMRSRV